MLVYRHPKYYEEMRKRARAHQKELQASQEKKAISPKQSTDSGGRAPSPQADKPTSSQALDNCTVWDYIRIKKG